MKKPVFLDTGYLIALLSKRDMRHNDAIAAASVYIGHLTTIFAKPDLKRRRWCDLNQD